MKKQQYTSYLKFLIFVSCLFIVILLVFFRNETMINTNTMTKEFYYEYMSRDTQKYSMILLWIVDFLVFLLYLLSAVCILDKIYRYGVKNLAKFFKAQYLFVTAMFIIVAAKKIILNTLMEYHIAVYFITPLIVAFTTIRYVNSDIKSRKTDIH